MPFERPTLSQLTNRVETDIKSVFNIVTVARRSFIVGISRAIGGMAHLMYGFLVFISRQAFADTAEDEFLLRTASIYGISLKDATFSRQ